MPQLLVVEDDAAIRKLVVEDLLSRGYTVDAARNGQEALHQLDLFRPPAIVLDLIMPVMGDWSFLCKYRERSRGSVIPIVVVSATADVSSKFAALGVRRFLRKPFDLDELASAVSDVVQEDRVRSAS
jgi:CheY-like chemotaxis protein